jgi:hypothetical protein
MFRNLADALHDLAVLGYDIRQLKFSMKSSKNSAQAQGDFLEIVIKDILCGVKPTDSSNRSSLYEQHLAYQGSRNNPPDAMLRGGDFGDAFEIKKKEKGNGGLALNSSYPYSHLESNLNRLLDESKKCEKWTRRDFFYAVGNASEKTPLGNSIWIVQGAIYAQDLKHFRDLENELKPVIDGAIKGNGMKPGETKELGRINNVDLLNRTDLRIRGMWGIKGPSSVFGGLPGVAEAPTSHLVVHTVVSKAKWTDLLKDRSKNVKKFWEKPSGNAAIFDVQVDDPNRTNLKIEAKLIRIEIQ